ncbi:MAG TPA: hypothetical protein PLO78_06940 [Candidatus Omnitrophota bacterium]|nr:hypothetical protein [Candidatus Omnitrophota bacterium]
MEEYGTYLKKIEAILEKNSVYKFESYTFVLAALHDTVSKFKKPRHISGKELTEGIRNYALQQFGPMTTTVLNYWGVYKTIDFGKIVFSLIEAKLLSKQPEDKLEDFENIYEFDEAFEKGYKIEDE